MNFASTALAATALAAANLVLAVAPIGDRKEPEEELGLYWEEEPVMNQEQLEEKVGLYWAALLRGDYKAVYDMFPPDARSMIPYPDWLAMHGISEEEGEASGYELVSAVIEGIRRTDHPNFSHLVEVFTRLRIRSPDGTLEEGVQSNVWELSDDGTWYPNIPVMPAP